MESSAVNSGNLVHLEEYVDTIISLPHEIQRNLTMIREHDSLVQESEMDLFKDVNEFMCLQNKTKEISTSERVELIKRIKNSFLSTLTHCEEKVSLASQCYNSVEKHLIKMEEDLKCFEEEVRLAGYAELLEKVRIERQRQKEQVRNKKRREAALINETEDVDEEDGDGDDNGNGNENENEQQQEFSDSSNEQQQQSNGKKRRTATSVTTTSRNTRRQANNPNTNLNDKKKVDSDDEEVLNTKVSRAERLLRRNKPNYVSNEVVKDPIEEKNKEDAIDNQGDDEAEDNEEGSERSEGSEPEPDSDSEIEGKREGSESEGVKEEPSDNSPSTLNPNTNILTVNSTRPSRDSITGSSAGSSGDDRDRTTSSRRPSKPPGNPPGNEPIYCTCQRVSFGQMIACDGKECPIEWFHIACVGLKSLPKGKWYCKECQEAMDAKTAAQLASGMATRSSRRTQ